ncbi:trypsin-like peptidase domain-containing protein [Streptomyces sp. NPDC088197]|uniref:trypsin-like peptidase domain-containing protein n=1 Tax=Streptomyces sp. NPDC088197 TaxID=3365840 RepID=UPI0037FF05FD
MTEVAGGFDAARVAEILVTRDGAAGRRGSGYVVAAGRVLTAAHVVAGASTVRVRLDAGLAAERVLNAEVHWAEAEVDVAVLSVSKEGQEAFTPVEYARVSARSARLTCAVMGFPLFKVRDEWGGAPFRDAFHDAQCTCDVLSNRKEGTLDLRVAPPAHFADPTRSPWAGMSGAAVWCRDRVIGIVGHHHPTDGLDHLAVLRADAWHARLGDAAHLLEESVDVTLDPGQLVDVVPTTSVEDLPREGELDMRLRSYLDDAGHISVRHPYRFPSLVEPPLNEVYLTQLASRRGGRAAGGDTEPPGTERVTAESLVGRHRGVQVVGGPGAGKSSLLRSIAGDSARQWLEGGGGAAEGVPTVLPILVRAEDLITEPGGIPDRLTRAVQRELGGTTLGTDELNALFRREPPAGTRWLVLIDGLDEVPSWRRIDVLHVIGRLRDRPGWQVMVASRPLPDGILNRIGDDEHPTYAIEPFLPEELPAFAEKWFRAVGKPDPVATAALFTREVERNPRLREFARIPLIATMMCVVYAEDVEGPGKQLPFNRSELYERFIDILVQHRNTADARQRHRSLIDEGDAEAQQGVTDLLREVLPLLERLAHDRLVFGGTGSDLLDRATALSAVPRPASVTPHTWRQILRGVLEHSGLLEQREGSLRFLHPSIEEYLAALYLFGHGGPRRHLERRRWPWEDLETKVFLAGLQAAADPAGLEKPLARLLRWPDRGTHRFVVELVANGIPVPDRILRRAAVILREVVIRFDRGQSAEEWEAACRQLALLDKQELVSALERLGGKNRRDGNARSRVAETAAAYDRALGLRLMSAVVTDRGLDSGVRLHMAKTLGRYAPDNTVAVHEVLAADETMGDHRAEAAEAVDRHDPARGLVLFRQLTRVGPAADGPDPLRVAMAYTRCHLGEGLNYLEELANGRWGLGGERRVAAARALMGYDAGRGVSTAYRLVDDRQLQGAEETWRIEAAGLLPMFGQDTALRSLLRLCADPSLSDRGRVTAGRTAGRFHRQLGAEALVRLADSWTPASGAMAVEAATAAIDFFPRLGAEALERIARGGAHESFRLQAAQALPTTGYPGHEVREVWRALCWDRALTDSTRLTAAREADRRGDAGRAEALLHLAYEDSVTPEFRLRAAKSAAERGDPSAASALSALALSEYLANDVRRAAAEAVPDPAARAHLLYQLGP